MLYEWFFIVPTISILCETPFCGDTDYHFKVEGINSQDIICALSTGFLWFSMLLAVLVDNGVRAAFFCLLKWQLAFITVMAIVGWIRGYKTQGASRALLQIELDDLYKRLETRFLNFSANIEARYTALEFYTNDLKLRSLVNYSPRCPR